MRRIELLGLFSRRERIDDVQARRVIIRLENHAAGAIDVPGGLAVAAMCGPRLREEIGDAHCATNMSKRSWSPRNAPRYSGAKSPRSERPLTGSVAMQEAMPVAESV